MKLIPHIGRNGNYSNFQAVLPVSYYYAYSAEFGQLFRSKAATCSD